MQTESKMWSAVEVYCTRKLAIKEFQLTLVQHHVPESIDEPAWIVSGPEKSGAIPQSSTETSRLEDENAIS